MPFFSFSAQKFSAFCAELFNIFFLQLVLLESDLLLKIANMIAINRPNFFFFCTNQLAILRESNGIFRIDILSHKSHMLNLRLADQNYRKNYPYENPFPIKRKDSEKHEGRPELKPRSPFRSCLIELNPQLL